MLPQFPGDHKPKSDLHLTSPLYEPASVVSLVQNLDWTVTLLLVVLGVVVVQYV